MTPTLRDALQAVRINRMKARAAKAWHRTQCPNCRDGRSTFAGLDAVLRALNDSDEPQAPAAPVSHLN